MSHPTPIALRRPFLLIASLVLSVALLSTLGCQADTEIKQGAEGEYCNGQQNDCRPSLSCVNYVCHSLTGPTRCQEVCERFESCGVTQPNCNAACENTVAQWGADTKETFALCLIEDLSCEEIQHLEDAPQECYNRLPLPDERNDLCREFSNALLECDASQDTSELRRACRYMARTRSEDVWAYTDECIALIVDGLCPDIYSCFNDTFDINPPLVW